MIQSIRQFISNQSNQIFGNRRIPLHFAYGVFGGLSVLFANCQAAFAATKDIQSFSYKARATGPKRPQGQGDIIVQLDGNASLYLKTGKIAFSYNVNIGLFLGNDQLDWKHNERIKISFKLFCKDGQLLECFDISETQGHKELTCSMDPKILSRVAKIEALINY